MTNIYCNYRVSSDVTESQTSEITGGIQKIMFVHFVLLGLYKLFTNLGSALQPWKRESVTNSRSEYVTNWRDRHIGYTGTTESGIDEVHFIICR